MKRIAPSHSPIFAFAARPGCNDPHSSGSRRVYLGEKINRIFLGSPFSQTHNSFQFPTDRSQRPDL